MFRNILFTAVSCIAGIAQAQLISVTGGKEQTYYLDQALTTDCKMPFKNISGKPLLLAYKQIKSTFPESKWLVSFCDNRSCFPNLVQEDSFATIPKDAETEFKITVVPQGYADTAVVQYEVYDKANPSVKDTVTFNFIVQWGAGLHEATRPEARVYPNPAHAVVFVDEAPVGTEVHIYSADSRHYKTVIIGREDHAINLQGFAPGFYFVSYEGIHGLVRSAFIKQ